MIRLAPIYPIHPLFGIVLQIFDYIEDSSLLRQLHIVNKIFVEVLLQSPDVYLSAHLIIVGLRILFH